VSDLAAPAEIATWTSPDSNSQAEYDHHAFLYWPATSQLVLPINQWGRDGRFEDSFFGAVVLHVDRAGINEVGRVAHDAVTPPAELVCGPQPEPRPADSKSYCEPQPQPDPVQRSLVIGSDLWTLGQWVLQQNALADLSVGAKVAVA
jgi:hypothetical protein